MSTWNPSDTYSAGRPTLSNGNLTAVDSGGTTAAGIRGTTYQTSGKYYFEIDASASPPVANDTERVFIVGIATSSYNLAGSSSTQVRALYVNLRHDTGIGYTSSGILTSGYDEYGNPTEDYDFGTYYAPETLAGFDTLGVAVDLDNHKIWFRDSNGWFFSGNPATGANPIWSNSSGDVNNFNSWTNVYPVLFTNRHTASKALAQTTANFGASTFTYTVPSGFVAWDVSPLLPSGNSDISIVTQGTLTVGVTWLSTANTSLSITGQGTLFSEGVFLGNTDLSLSAFAALNSTDTLLGAANTTLDLSTTGNLTQPTAITMAASLTFSLQGTLAENNIEAIAVSDISYGMLSFGIHTTSYESDTGQVVNAHESSWRLTTEGVHEISWNSENKVSVSSFHDASYLSLGGVSAVSATHDTSWFSSGSISAVWATHEITYDSYIRIPGYTVHEISWSSVGSTSLVVSIHESAWASSGTSINTALTTHTSSWSSTPTVWQSHTTRYQSVVESLSTQTTTWRSFVEENIGIHEVKYRSYTMDPQFILANAYIELEVSS